MHKTSPLTRARFKFSLVIGLLLVGLIGFFAWASTSRFSYRADTLPSQIGNTVTAAFTQPDGSTDSVASNTAFVQIETVSDTSSGPIQDFALSSVSGKRLSLQRFTVSAVTTQKARVTFRFMYKSMTDPVPTSVSASSLDRLLTLSSAAGLEHTSTQSGNANTYLIGQFTATAANGTTADSDFYILKADSGAVLEKLVAAGALEENAPAAPTPTPTPSSVATATPTATPAPASDGTFSFTETTGSRSQFQSQAVSVSSTLSEKAQQVRIEYAYWPSTTALPTEAPTLDRSESLTLKSGTEATYTAAWSGNSGQHVIFRAIAKSNSGTEITSDTYIIDAEKGSVAKKY